MTTALPASTNIRTENQCSHIIEPFADDYSAFGLKALVSDTRSQFQHIQILDTHSYGRALYLDGAIQSAEYDEYIYHEALVHPLLANLTSPPTRVLILGGGEGASAREVLRYDSVAHVDMVDIDGELMMLCREHLPTWSDGAFDDDRLTVHIQDALTFIDEMTGMYDAILIDLIDEFSSNIKNELVEQLYSHTFFSRLKEHLSPQGALVIQASEFNAGEFDSFAHIYRKVQPLFTQVEPYSAFVPSFTSEWGFILCHHQPEPLFGLQRPAEVDIRINALDLEENLAFYDGLTHQRMFSLPKDLRTLIADNFVEQEDATSVEETGA